jgi:hypothetical protein
MRATLLFCGFSSPYALALLPMFLIWAWHSKGREQKILSSILTLCMVVQVGIAVKTRMKLNEKGVDPMRATAVRLDTTAANMLAEHMMYPALGFSLREKVLDLTGLKEPAFSASSFPPRPLTRTLRAGGWLSFLLLAGVLALLRGPTPFSTTNLMLATFVVMSLFTCVTALYSVPTGRYAFMPGVCFLLLILSNIDSLHSKLHHYVCMAVLAWALAAGIVAYPNTIFQDGPSWEGEVKKWKADPTYSLHVWPWSFVSKVNIIYPKQTR